MRFSFAFSLSPPRPYWGMALGTGERIGEIWDTAHRSAVVGMYILGEGPCVRADAFQFRVSRSRPSIASLSQRRARRPRQAHSHIPVLRTHKMLRIAKQAWALAPQAQAASQALTRGMAMEVRARDMALRAGRPRSSLVAIWHKVVPAVRPARQPPEGPDPGMARATEVRRQGWAPPRARSRPQGMKGYKERENASELAYFTKARQGADWLHVGKPCTTCLHASVALRSAGHNQPYPMPRRPAGGPAQPCQAADQGVAQALGALDWREGGLEEGRGDMGASMPLPDPTT
jgi:hypothetical protein